MTTIHHSKKISLAKAEKAARAAARAGQDPYIAASRSLKSTVPVAEARRALAALAANAAKRSGGGGKQRRDRKGRFS